MDLISLNNARRGVVFAIIGIILYPCLVFSSHIILPFLIQKLEWGNYSSAIRIILSIVPLFSIFFYFAAWNLTAVDLNIPYQNILKWIVRIFFLLYILMALTISLLAIDNQLETASLINSVKSIIWRVGSLFSFIYLGLVFYKLDEIEWAIITGGFTIFSVWEDIYYYLLRIQDITNDGGSHSLDPIFFTLACIVLAGTLFILYKLKTVIDKNIKKITPG